MKKYIGLIIAGLLPLIVSAQIVMSDNYYVSLNGGTQANPWYIVVGDSTPSGIVNNGNAWIISENEFNMVQWNIGQSPGTYVVPFGYGTSSYLPLVFNIRTNPGIGEGNIKFSTYHTSALNSATQPLDVTNLNPFILPGNPSNTDDSYMITDRFYIIDANTGYTTKPSPDNITFSYISTGGNSEVTTPNSLDERNLMAERFNSGAGNWSDWFGYAGTDAVNSGIGTVYTGPVPASGLYRSWALWDNNMALPLTTTVVNTTGCGNDNGSASITVHGGKPSYTYSWNPNVSTTATGTGLSAGTYTVTVTDANGSTGITTITITGSSPLALTTTVAQNVNCNSENNGNAIANASGGTSPYNYVWTSGTSSFVSNPTGAILSAGTYTVTVTDINGCTATASATITQPAPLSVTTSITANVSCNGGTNGNVMATATGGTSPYNYVWTSGTSSFVSNPTGAILSAGTYTVTVTDINGCTATASATITQPPPLSVTTTVTANVSCNSGNNGNATATATGGTSPYNYVWTSGTSSYALNPTGAVLSAGTYTVTVTDINGCSSTASVTITQPTPFSITIASQTNVTCSFGSGSATANAATGGTSPYYYNWAPGGVTNLTISNIFGGTYTITALDNNGCTATASVTITQPAGGITRDSIISITNVGCFGGNGGSAKVGVKGGLDPYTYQWAPSGGSSQTGTGLSAGTYTLTVSNLNGCSNTLSVTITQPPAIRDSIASITYPTCNGGTGSATIGVTGGTSPYSYTWTRGVSTTATATNLSAGSYTVTIKDNHSCSSVLTFSITQPPAIHDSIVKATTVNIPCNGEANGSVTVGIKGGTSPFTYTWSPNVSSTATATGLFAGTYSVNVTDINGCNGAATSVTITQPNLLHDSVSVLNNIGCNGGNGGIISIGTAGGTSPYTYSWSNGKTTYTISGLSSGTYSVTITDKHGCSNSLTVNITQPAAVLQASLSTISYPLCHGGDGSAIIRVTGGTSPYTYSWSPVSNTTTTATNLTVGIYTVTVHDNHSCISTIIVTITQPLAIRDSMVTANKVNVSCNGGNNGSATIGVKYGTVPYTYNWSNGQTNAIGTGLSAGVYTITVTDANGCTGTVTTTITQPALPLSDSIYSSSCKNNLITATVLSTGGTPPYTYSWSPGGGTRTTMSGLAQGIYVITVTDAHGCTSSVSKNLICGGIIKDDIDNQSSEPRCCIGMDDINLYPNPNSGQFILTGLQQGMTVGIYDFAGREVYSQYLITNPSLVINISDQPNGIYLIRITDKNGKSEIRKKVVKTQ